MPIGWLKRAATPVPSVEPLAPALPAKVVTFPDAIAVSLIVSLAESETKMLPPNVVIPEGSLKLAAAPIPSVDPYVRQNLPALLP